MLLSNFRTVVTSVLTARFPERALEFGLASRLWFALACMRLLTLTKLILHALSHEGIINVWLTLSFEA